jgi:hypothetical protein
MKLHQNVVETFVNFVRNFSGHTDASKLRNKFEACQLTIYKKQDGSLVLVETEKLVSEIRKQNGTVPDLASMYLHPSAVEHIMKLENMYGGYANESKLKNHFLELDFTPYQRALTNDTILVLTKDYMDALQGKRA